ncbi:hypothetical protein [Paraburkholderia diazotrophica]|uniref:hypothetical protein n=1 Tax=Paraburkholderia diazotrophica TaxID=667676 RepID=UPI00317D0C3B
MFTSTALTVFWTAITAVLHGCFELLGALLGVCLATSFVVLLIVAFGYAIFSAVSDLQAA